MIHEVGVELEAQFVAKKVPFAVIDGPEFRKTATFARERVVIEHDPAGDAFGPRRQTNTNARTRLTRLTGVKITIYAQCPNKGALYWEHIRRAEAVLDQVLIGIEIVAKRRANLVVWKSGKFFQPDDFKEGETPGGAAYELLFSFDRGVSDAAWDGTIQPTAPLTPQMQGGPQLTFAASGHTITRNFGSWLVDGFAVGASVIVSGSASNNGTLGPIATLTDTVMTFAAGITNEGPVEGVSVTGTGVVMATTTRQVVEGTSTESI